MHKSINIAVLLDSYNVGGSAKVVIQNLKFLTPDIHAFVILFNRKNTEPTELEIHLEKYGINYKSIHERCAFDPMAVFEVIKILKTSSVDIIESNHYKTHIIAFLATIFLRIPWVAVSHGWTSENLKVKFYNYLDRLALPFATVCLATGPSIVAKLKKIVPGNKRPRCLPTALDISELPASSEVHIETNKLKQELGLRNDDFVFVTVGRLSFEKGFDIFLDACKILSEHTPSFKAIIIGSGPEQANLIERSSMLGLQKQIFFAGQMSADKVISNYQNFDCLVIPSRSEGMPNVLLEAAYFKIPVIAADVGGIPDMMIGPLSNWLFKAGESQQLSKLMHLIINKSKPERHEIGIELNNRLNLKYLASQRTKKVHRLYRAIYRMKYGKLFSQLKRNKIQQLT